MQKIAEPTLEHYVYYVRRVEDDTRDTLQEHRSAFEREVRALLDHLQQCSGQGIPAWKWPQESEDRLLSQRIVQTSWLENEATGRSYLMAARTYGDIYCLQIGYCQAGKASPQVFAELRDEMWHPSAAGQLLGHSTYLCGIADQKAKSLAARALEAYAGRAPGSILSTRAARGRARLYGAPGCPHTTVLLYQAQDELWIGKHIVNDIALRLELYRHKAARQLGWCEDKWPILSDQEQVLRGLLARAEPGPPAHLEALPQLAQLYHVFRRNVGTFVERKMTIEVNLNNLDTVLEELRPRTRDRLLRSGRERLRQRYRQLETDLKFADLTGQKAEEIRRALSAEQGWASLIADQAGQGMAAVIERAGWTGERALDEREMTGLRTGRCWAVFVGINHYQDDSISDLTCCVADVEAVDRLLREGQHGDYRTRLLTDTSSGPQRPTRGNILTEASNTAQTAGQGDLILFYFSGHGIAQDDEAFLIPCDARLANLADTAIPLSRIKQILAGSPARANVIILDACHSGAHIGKAATRMSPEFIERVFAQAEGLAILASCQQGQLSYEWEQAGQSVFTHYLLEGLAGAADLDGKHLVTVQDANRYVAGRVKEWAYQRGWSQTPTLGGGWSGDIVLTRW